MSVIPKSNLWTRGAAALVMFSLVACGNSGSQVTTKPGTAAPMVLSNSPIDGATGIPVNGTVSASFSEAMDSSTLTANTFTLTRGGETDPIQGTVAYANSTAVFSPGTPLVKDSTYTAMLTTGARSASGIGLPANFVWCISTGGPRPIGLTDPVNLRSAGNFVIIAESGITNVPPSAINGNMGVSPITATAITGFTLIADTSNVFSTSGQVNGKVYAAGYAVPTPSNMTIAVGDMELAYADAAGRAPGISELGTGNIGGMSLFPGVYKWSGSVLIPTNVTLNGSATDVWILDIAQNLTMADSTNIILTGGALPKNVFWQVAGTVNLGSSAHLEGVVLGKTAITMGTGASVNGRLLTQTALTLDANTVTDGGNPLSPAVLATNPLNGATGVSSKISPAATFNVPMDPTTINSSTFTLASPTGPVSGRVMYSEASAIFMPSALLADKTTFTATLTTGAKSATGIALPLNYAWSFTTGGGVVTSPTVLSTIPANLASNVPTNSSVSATFSEAMDPATLTTSTFKLTTGAGLTPVPGKLTYANSVATFKPNTLLPSGAAFNATITTGAKSAFGVPLAANYAWSFNTGSTKATTLPVNLGTASNFVILAKSGISTVPASVITGDIGVSPAAATYITGFALTADATNVFSTSTQVTGKVFASNFAPPTPANMTTAVSDMQLAFTDAAGRPADVTELGAGNIGGMTLAPGVYSWGTSLLIPTNLTLNGSATDVWIFEIAQNLTMSNATKVFLTGGAVSKNVFWQVSGLADIGTTAHIEGIVLSQTAIRMKTGSSVNGRLLAQTAVTLDTSTVVKPAP